MVSPFLRGDDIQTVVDTHVDAALATGLYINIAVIFVQSTPCITVLFTMLLYIEVTFFSLRTPPPSGGGGGDMAKQQSTRMTATPRFHYPVYF